MERLNRTDGRAYIDWLAEHGERRSIEIHPLALLELAERAQARAAAIKGTAQGIIAEMEEIGTERIGYDERGSWHGPGGIQRASVAAETVPLRVRMVNAAWLALAISIVGGAWAGLIWAVIRMVQKAGLPW